jgi:hypothetical protein
LNVIKLLKIYDKTKPRLEKVEAFIYVLQHITQKEAAPILTQPGLRMATTSVGADGGGKPCGRKSLRPYKLPVGRLVDGDVVNWGEGCVGHYQH